MSRDVIVLVYHHIGDSKEKGIPEGYGMEAGRFEKQMALLSRRRVISLEECLSNQEKKRALTENAVLLTFDDGYQSFYTTVYPILKKYRLPATVFLPTDAVEGKSVSWNPAMKDLTSEERMSLFLRWNQIREMEEGGIRFGSHSKSHADLTALPKERLLEELESSWDDLKEHLSHPLPALSYPFGLWNETVEEAARKAGYCVVFSLERKQNIDSPFRMGRLEITPDDSHFLFTSKVNGTYSLMRTLEGRLKRGVRKALLWLDIDIRMRYLPVLRYLKQYDPERKESVLEIGSGPLGLTRYLKRKIVGLDRDFCGKISPWLTGCQGDASRISFRDRSFDHVISVDLVENLTPGERVLSIQEMLRVARKGILIVTPCSKESQKAEEALQNVYLKQGRTVPAWLAHHLRTTLPEEEELVGIIQEVLQKRHLQAHLFIQSNQPLSVWRFCNCLFAYGTIPFLGMMLLLWPFWPFFSLFVKSGKPYRKVFLISLSS